MKTVIPIREEFGRFREPTLQDILSDPIVEAVMRADSVDPGRLNDMLGWIADELQANVPSPFPKPAIWGERQSPIPMPARWTPPRSRPL
jgi:hypothetical protein